MLSAMILILITIVPSCNCVGVAEPLVSSVSVFTLRHSVRVRVSVCVCVCVHVCVRVCMCARAHACVFCVRT